MLLPVGACMREPVQLGDDAATDFRANIGYALPTGDGLQVALYRNPMVARGITVYRVHAPTAAAPRRFFDAMVADMGLSRSDGVDRFQRDMVRGIGRADRTFDIDFDTGTVAGAKICPQIAAGDPSGLIVVLSAEQGVYVVLYGGSFVRARTRGAMAPLRSRCPFGAPA